MGISRYVSPEPMSIAPNLGSARIALWIALGTTSWAVLVAVTILALHLVA
jgi:hypothetical protein